MNVSNAAAPSACVSVMDGADLSPTASPVVMHRLVAVFCIGMVPWVCRAGTEMIASADGTEVVSSTGIVWARCVEGMRWTGRTCAGTPRWLSHSEAVAVVASRRQLDGAAWRLPRVRELETLFHRADRTQGIDDRLFPAAPLGWHWTSTARLDMSSVNQYNYGNIRRGVTSENVNRISYLHGWAVNAQTGEANANHLKKSRLLVRLVRPAGPGEGVPSSAVLPGR